MTFLVQKPNRTRLKPPDVLIPTIPRTNFQQWIPNHRPRLGFPEIPSTCKTLMVRGPNHTVILNLATALQRPTSKEPKPDGNPGTKEGPTGKLRCAIHFPSMTLCKKDFVRHASSIHWTPRTESMAECTKMDRNKNQKPPPTPVVKIFRCTRKT